MLGSYVVLTHLPACERMIDAFIPLVHQLYSVLVGSTTAAGRAVLYSPVQDVGALSALWSAVKLYNRIGRHWIIENRDWWLVDCNDHAPAGERNYGTRNELRNAIQCYGTSISPVFTRPRRLVVISYRHSPPQTGTRASAHHSLFHNVFVPITISSTMVTTPSFKY